eukprot:TRINITY_DN15480_c0_g1_i1.p2 TRINITY_DN15480_c0_g1~~TRINITY_DN15480_c0_g1_i1.p2  ORF type:complete len:142 (+),score=21.57 TRINITY_DN15480_c0_g1_i1:63-428(+)
MALNFNKAPVQKFGLQTKPPPKVMVFKCGDKHDRGKEFLINKNFRTLDQLHQKVAQQIGFMPSIRGLYTTDGRVIRGLDEIEDRSMLLAVRQGETFSQERIPNAVLAALQSSTEGEADVLK